MPPLDGSHAPTAVHGATFDCLLAAMLPCLTLARGGADMTNTGDGGDRRMGARVSSAPA